MVGDSFLEHAFVELKTVKKKAKAAGQETPFLFQHFNVSAYHAKFGVAGIHHFLTLLIDALSDDCFLPHYLVMVLDKDILSILRKNPSTLFLGAAMHYLIKKIDVTLQRRKQDLSEKRPGALSANDTKVIWIRMLKRPPGLLPCEDLQLFALRGKFNSMLEEHLLEGDVENHHIMSIEGKTEDFDPYGNLTQVGMQNFWHEVIKAIKRFHRDEIKLRPRPPQKPSQQFHQSLATMATVQIKSPPRKLPSPPLKKRRSQSKTRSRSRNYSSKKHKKYHTRSRSRDRRHSHDRSHLHKSHRRNMHDDYHRHHNYYH